MINEITKHREEEKIHQFLIGLDNAIFGTMRSNILQIDPIPNIKKVYAMIIKEEAQRKMIRTVEIGYEAIVFAGPKSNSIQYSYCFKQALEAKNCYLLVGFPGVERQTERWSTDAGTRGRKGRGPAKQRDRPRQNTLWPRGIHLFSFGTAMVYSFPGKLGMVRRCNS
ncbi:hypothetical protein M9H77_31475 [Catharanthus roseus]|uniref:Uncharacterized protein n=1 Tax=Catharanthus roseus TaxID=4058 RepID=A0ACC0A2K0_CATRO|nr:hypothetical protein M9H77_31475 [Catharanthus roseus]